MRVLVTGSTGHVGGAIAHALHAVGHAVVGLSRGTSERLPASVAQHQVTLGAEDFPDRAAHLPVCDAVVHAAACIETCGDGSELSRVNCLGTDQLLNLAKQWKVKRFLFISSIAVEGLPQTAPMTEDHPLAPGSPYAASKLYGECAVAAAGLSSASLRITSPVGPGLERRRIFSIFVRKALAGEAITVGGQGTRRQNYVDVRDIATAVDQLLAGTATGVYHVAGADSISNLDLAKRCVAEAGSETEVSLSGAPDPQDALAWEISCARAREAFGYVPRFDIGASIRDLAASYQDATER